MNVQRLILGVFNMVKCVECNKSAYPIEIENENGYFISTGEYCTDSDNNIICSICAFRNWIDEINPDPY